MRRSDLALSTAVVVMSVVASTRASVLLQGSYLPDQEPISATHHLTPPTARVAPPAEWARPLFSRPISAASVDVSNDAMTTSSATSKAKLPRLVGVIINNNDRIAILSYGEKLLRVNANGKIGPWILTHIDRRSATLQSENESHHLKLDANAP